MLEGAARTFPKDSNTLYQLADMYKDAGRHPDAEKALRQLLSAEPANANALNYLGYLLALRGDRLDEAIDLVRKALVAEPDNGAFLDSLGWAYFRKGDLGEAEKYLGQAASRCRATPRCRITWATCSPSAGACRTRSTPGRARSTATAATSIAPRFRRRSTTRAARSGSR